MAQKMTASSHSQARSSRKAWIIVAGIFGALIVFIGLVILFFSVGRPLLTPKKTVTFEPDRVLLGSRTVSQDTLQETAKVLAQRWNLMGYGSSWTSFSATADGQIIARMPDSINTDFIDRLKVNGVLEFVDFGGHSVAPGTEVNTDYTYGYLSARGQNGIPS